VLPPENVHALCEGVLEFLVGIGASTPQIHGEGGRGKGRSTRSGISLCLADSVRGVERGPHDAGNPGALDHLSTVPGSRPLGRLLGPTHRRGRLGDDQSCGTKAARQTGSALARHARVAAPRALGSAWHRSYGPSARFGSGPRPPARLRPGPDDPGANQRLDRDGRAGGLVRWFEERRVFDPTRT